MVYIEESQVIISKQNLVFLSLKIDFGLANSADPDAAFHLGLYFLPFKGFWYTNG